MVSSRLSSIFRPSIRSYVPRIGGKRKEYDDLKRVLKKMEQDGIPDVQAYLGLRESFARIEVLAIRAYFDHVEGRGVPGVSFFTITSQELQARAKKWRDGIRGLDIKDGSGEPMILFFNLWRAVVAGHATYEMLHEAITSLCANATPAASYASYLQAVVVQFLAYALNGMHIDSERSILITVRAVQFLCDLDRSRADAATDFDHPIAHKGKAYVALKVISREKPDSWTEAVALRLLGVRDMFKAQSQLLTVEAKELKRAYDNSHIDWSKELEDPSRVEKAEAVVLIGPRYNIVYDQKRRIRYVLPDVYVVFGNGNYYTQFNGKWVSTGKQLQLEPWMHVRQVEEKPTMMFDELVPMKNLRLDDEAEDDAGRWIIGTSEALAKVMQEMEDEEKEALSISRDATEDVAEAGTAVDSGEEVGAQESDAEDGSEAVVYDDTPRHGMQVRWAAEQGEDGAAQDGNPGEHNGDGNAVGSEAAVSSTESSDGEDMSGWEPCAR